MHPQLNLLSVSSLEKVRVKEPTPDPLYLTPFQGLEEMIFLSLGAPGPAPISEPKTSAHRPLTPSDLPFQDQALLQKLIQFRNRIPLSPRIIRTQDS